MLMEETESESLLLVELFLVGCTVTNSVTVGAKLDLQGVMLLINFRNLI